MEVAAASLFLTMSHCAHNQGVGKLARLRKKDRHREHVALGNCLLQAVLRDRAAQSLLCASAGCPGSPRRGALCPADPVLRCHHSAAFLEMFDHLIVGHVFLHQSKVRDQMAVGGKSSRAPGWQMGL